jgi:hydroxymethylpyrimidine pyrophosphatase-like HAD family hydrolase
MREKIKDLIKDLEIALDRNIKYTEKALKPRQLKEVVHNLNGLVGELKQKTHEQAFKSVRAIFFDIDGTLMQQGKTSKKLLGLLDQLMKKGIIVGIASGRARFDMHKFEFVKNFNGPLIFEEGCLILKNKSIDLIWDKKITPTLKYLRKIAQKYGHYDIRWKERSFSIYSATDFPEVKTLRNISVYRNRNHLNITPSIASKGLAIAYLSKKLKIPLKQICCVGDDYNDITMLQTVGLPCAVGNAFKSIKEAVKERHGYIAKKTAASGCMEIVRKIL